MKSIYYLDLARERGNIPSDYALAKRLDVTKETVSHIRMGKMRLSDALALKIAPLAGVPEWQVLFDVQMERAKTPETKAMWERLMQAFDRPEMAGVLEKISASFNGLISRAKPRRSLLPAG